MHHKYLRNTRTHLIHPLHRHVHTHLIPTGAQLPLISVIGSISYLEASAILLNLLLQSTVHSHKQFYLPIYLTELLSVGIQSDKGLSVV